MDYHSLEISSIKNDMLALKQENELLQKRVALLENPQYPPDCFSIEEIMAMTKKSKRTIDSYISDRKLRVRYPLAHRKIHKDDLEAFLRGVSGKR